MAYNAYGGQSQSMGGHQHPGGIDPTRSYRIYSVHSNYALSTHNGKMEAGEKIVQTDRLDKTHSWKFIPVGPMTYCIQMAANANLSMDIEGASTKDGGHLIVYHHSNAINQQFQIEPVGPGKYKIMAKVSHKSLDVPGWSKKDQEKIVQYTYNGGENQLWRLEAVH